jgi:hypothetical protein
MSTSPEGYISFTPGGSSPNSQLGIDVSDLEPLRTELGEDLVDCQIVHDATGTYAEAKITGDNSIQRLRKLGFSILRPAL